MTTTEYKKNLITSINIIGAMYSNTHPDVATRTGRDVLNRLDRKVMSMYDDTSMEAWNTITSLYTDLRTMHEVMAKVPEAPLNIYISSLSKYITSRTNTYNTECRTAESISSTDIDWTVVISQGYLQAPNRPVMLRPEAAMVYLRKAIDPPSLDVRNTMYSVMSDKFGITHLPSASHWIRLMAGMHRYMESNVRINTRLPRVATSKVTLLDRVPAHINMDGTHTIFVRETPDYSMIFNIECRAGMPIDLVMTVSLNREFYSHMYKIWVRDTDYVQDISNSDVSMALTDIKEVLQDAIGHADPRFYSCVKTGISAAGMNLLNVEATTSMEVVIPHRESDKHYDYMSSVGEEVTGLLYNRSTVKNAAIEVARQLNIHLMDVRFIHSSTRTTYTCGISIWWSIPDPTMIDMDELVSSVTKLIQGLGSEVDDSDRSDNVAEDTASMVIHKSSDLSDRIRNILSDKNLVLPENVKTSLKVLLKELDVSGNTENIKDKSDLSLVIPNKLNFIKKHYRKGSLSLTESPNGFRTIWNGVKAKIESDLEVIGNISNKMGIKQKDTPSGIISAIESMADIHINKHQRYPHSVSVMGNGNNDCTVANTYVACVVRPRYNIRASYIDGSMRYEIKFKK